ncbi:MAG: bifunctional diguanylate cyclase/phosphodiesterase [Paracoccaceae bacterium]
MKIDDIFPDFLKLTADAVGKGYAKTKLEMITLVWVNQAFCDSFEMSEEEALGKSPVAIIDSDYVDDLWEMIQEKISGGQKRFSIDTSCKKANGKTFWANISFLHLDDPKTGGRYTVFDIREINDLKNREQAAELALIEHELLYANMEALKVRLETAINTIPDPFAIYSSKEKLMIWNPAYAEGLGELKKGMSAESYLRLGLDKQSFPDAIGREDEWLQDVLVPFREKKTHTFPLVLNDQSFRVQQFTAANGDKLVLRTNITEIQAQQAKLESYAEQLEKANQDISYQALHDELTGLGNRRYLSMRFEEMASERERKGGELAALHIDLDRFKQINDTMGHAAGDFVLKAVADRLRENVRTEDVLARIGGDEFFILIRCGHNSDWPEALADRIVRLVGRPLEFEERPCRFGVSVGVAQTPLIAAEDLLTSSDVALYKAKDGGRARAASFDQKDLQQLRETKKLSDDIQRGLECGEFVPYYQALVDAKTFEPQGFEVLARWQHPTEGLLLPCSFLATASEMQLESQIDRMIFKKAINECATHFTDGFAPSLSFNVSLARIMDPELVTDAHRLHYRGQVSLELLETIFLEEETEEVMMRIDTLRDMGFDFAVDDFGSGRASIIALQNLAPDRLKIDGRLIAPITKSQSARKLVRSIIEIGQSLDVRVTAEGVETKEHAEILSGTHCDILQGYFFAHPSPFEEAKKLILEPPKKTA